jgi:hypothetical protein
VVELGSGEAGGILETLAALAEAEGGADKWAWAGAVALGLMPVTTQPGQRLQRMAAGILVAPLKLPAKQRGSCKPLQGRFAHPDQPANAISSTIFSEVSARSRWTAMAEW